MAKILSGRTVADLHAKRLITEIKRLHLKPKLVIIQVGDRKESNTYVGRKKAFGEKIGAEVLHKRYSESVSEKKIISDISKFNHDRKIHGIMMQLPVTPKLDARKILDSIDPKKDVDGLNSRNTQAIIDKRETYLPAVTRGVMTLLKHYKIPLEGKRVVVVGASALVGRPTALALINRGATVTICNTKTKNLRSETKQAEIVVVATGHAHLITPAHVSRGQVVIDVGISVDEDRRIHGDVDFKKVSKIVKAITPVPGGVGPMTVLSLFENLLQATSSRQRWL